MASGGAIRGISAVAAQARTLPHDTENAIGVSPFGSRQQGDALHGYAGLTNAVCARLTSAFDLAARVVPAHEAWAAAWRFVGRGRSLATLVPTNSNVPFVPPAARRPMAIASAANLSNALPWPREAAPGSAGRSASSSRLTAHHHAEALPCA